MNEIVRPDKIITIPIEDGELEISPTHDFIHHWPRIGAYILKLVVQDGGEEKQANLPLNKEQVDWLIDNCGMEQPYIRTFIGATEHEHWLDYQTSQLGDLDFEIGE